MSAAFTQQFLPTNRFMQFMMVRPVFRTTCFLLLVSLMVSCTLVLPEAGEDSATPHVDEPLATPVPEDDGFVSDTDYQILEDGEYSVERFPAGQNFILLDHFDSHTWIDSGKPYFPSQGTAPKADAAPTSANRRSTVRSVVDAGRVTSGPRQRGENLLQMRRACARRNDNRRR
ncbi:MAG: hypothetical protein AAGD96_23125 [Chloroflexota bacterium]